MAENLIPCRNCSNLIDGNYCTNCGQPKALKRVNGHYILHEIQHQMHFEKGILYTIKQMMLHPGKAVREFIAENRERLVKPIVFIIITSLVYSFADHFFHVEEGYIKNRELSNSSIGAIFAWIDHHYGYANMMMGVMIALWLQLFFRKYPFNFFEILIMLCFVMGMAMMIFAIFIVAEGLTHIKLMGVAAAVAFAYSTWAIAKFFSGRKFMDYVKSFVAYLLGYSTFMFLALLFGYVADVLIHH